MRKLWWTLLVAIGIATPRAASAFCGFYVGGADAKLFNNATQVVLMRDGQRTVLSMQNAYRGPPENFAMVVPVPVVLQKESVKTLPPEIFDRVDRLTSPRLVEYWEMDPCEKPLLGIGRMNGPAAGAPMRAAAPAMSARDLGVKVEAQFTVGEYEIVILSAKDSNGLATWLVENKYKIPDGAEPYLRPYVANGSKFFVAKVNAAKVKFEGTGDEKQAVLSPLRFFYDAERFTLPIRLGLINSNGTQDLIVSVLAKRQRYEAANYRNVTVPTNIDVSEDAQDKFPAFYAALFDKTIEEHPKTMVTEYSWGAGSCDPCPGPQAALTMQELATLGEDVLNVPLPSAGSASTPAPAPAPAPAGSYGAMPGASPRPMMPSPRFFGGGLWTITRLHARYSKESLGEDIVLKAAPPIVGGREIWEDGKLEKRARVIETPYAMSNFQARYAIRHAWKGAIACESPVRGRWGGPPNPNSNWQSTRSDVVRPATKLGFAPRGGIMLAALLREDVPELALKANAPDKTPPTTTAVADVPTAPALLPAPSASNATIDAGPPTVPGAIPEKKETGGCGACSAAARDGGGVIAIGTAGLVALAIAARRRRS